MASSFPCTSCGKAVTVDDQPGSKVSCSHCQAALVVPDAPANSPPTQPPALPQAAGAAAPDVDPAEVPEDHVSGALAAVVPWVISLLFHLGLLLVMVLVTMIATAEKIDPDTITIPHHVLSDNPGARMTQRQAATAETQRTQERERTVPTQDPRTNRTPTVIAPGSASSAASSIRSMDTAAPTGMFGAAVPSGNIHHIVFVIDRTGSMTDKFEEVRFQMLLTINELRPQQNFHIILLTDDQQPIELPGGRLRPATDANKQQAALWLYEQRTHWETDPVPALRRAFDVLDQADNRGKLIHLLTDGEGMGAGWDEGQVMPLIQQRNANRSVHINTYLYTMDRKQAAERLLQRLAEQSGGVYTYVPVD